MASMILSPNFHNELLGQALVMVASVFELTAHKPHDRQHGQTQFVTTSPASVPATDWLSAHTDQPDQVRQFLTERGILSGAVNVVGIAERTFPGNRRVSLAVEQDPESDAKWLVVDVNANGSPEDALASYDRFIKEWSRYPDPNARQLINLTFCCA